MSFLNGLGFMKPGSVEGWFKSGSCTIQKWIENAF